jgi:hypothetical protein
VGDDRPLPYLAVHSDELEPLGNRPPVTAGFGGAGPARESA